MELSSINFKRSTLLMYRLIGMKKVVLSYFIILCLLSTVFLMGLVFNIGLVRASGAIYIRADGSVDPPTVPIQRDGNIYIFTANIYDRIVVQRSNITIDGADYTLQGYQSGDGFSLSDVSNVTIKSTHIKKFVCGMNLNGSSIINVFGNNITNNYYGIILKASSNNTIHENSIIANDNDGIFLQGDCFYNHVFRNNITNSDTGLLLHGSSCNSIYKNNITNNSEYGVRTLWPMVHPSPSNNNTFFENNIKNNGYGIYLLFSSHNNLYRNNIVDGARGIYIEGVNNTVSGNSITNSGRVGVILWESSNNTVSGNSITNSGSQGLWLNKSSNSTVFENNIINNAHGIVLHGSSYNVIYRNNIKNNTGTGIHVGGSNNKLYHNNLINNTLQAYSATENNVWDDGYPSGGNYWSDHEIVDELGGPNQDQPGSDGIVDTAYFIEAYNLDCYPLVNPWTQTPPTPDFLIVASPHSLTIQQGGSDTSLVTITSTDGFNQAVQLTMSGVPSDVTATLNPEQVTPPPDGLTTSTLTVSVDTTATLGSYTLTVNGTSGTLTHSKDITLEIKTLSETFLTLPFNDPDVVVGWIFDPTQHHYGVDFIKCSDIGDVTTWQPFSVVAAADGEAFWAEEKDPEGNYKGWGKYVYIKHYEKATEGRNYYTLYAHLESVDPNIPKEGDGTYTIQRGELIGRAGATGVADPSWIHLHFEAHKGDARSKDKVSDRLDPYDLNQDRDSRYGEKATSIRCGPNYLWATDPPSQPSIVKLVITSPLEITPFKDIYYVGDTLTAKFTITNRGTESVTFNVLVVGGRDPGGEVVDFDKAYGITLNPSDSYDYQRSLPLPEKSGSYHFFCAYQTLDGNWNTNIDVEIDGKIVEDFDEAKTHRETDILAFKEIYVHPPPHPLLWDKISGPWEAESRDKWACLSQIVVHPNDPEVIYAVVEEHHCYLEYQGDKLYKTVNGGADWNPINEGLPLEGSLYWSSIGAMAIAPSNPNIIYIGTSARDPYSGLTSSAAGIYRSTNGGQEWESIDGPSGGWWKFRSHYSVSSMVVDPTNSDVVYVGTIGGGIWRTTNGGQSWKEIWHMPVHKETLLEIISLAISPANPSTVYAVAYNFAPSDAMTWSGFLVPGCIIKSVDGGETWEILLKQPHGKIEDIAVSETNAEILYFVTGVAQGHKVKKSEDGGETWRDVSGTAGPNPLPDVDPVLRTLGIYGTRGQMASICMHPVCSDVIYVASEWTFGDVYWSCNSGENWFPLGMKDEYGKEVSIHVQELTLASDADSRVLYTTGFDGLLRIDLSGGAIILKLDSPGELRVYDFQGRVTGLVNSEIREEIPNSAYFNNTIEILSLSDSYRYEVAGTEDETYGLVIASIIRGESNCFTATDIPTSPDAIHQYTVDWDALSRGEEGVTVQVDSDGDGVFELTFTSDSKLTEDEFILQPPARKPLPLWVVGAAVAAIATVTAAIAVLWRKRKNTQKETHSNSENN